VYAVVDKKTAGVLVSFPVIEIYQSRHQRLRYVAAPMCRIMMQSIINRASNEHVNMAEVHSSRRLVGAQQRGWHKPTATTLPLLTILREKPA